MNEGREHPTAYIHLYPQIEELRDADDQLHEPTSALRQFLSVLPSVHIEPEEVEDIKASEFDAQVEALETQWANLIRDKKKLQDKIEKDRVQVEKQVADMKNSQKEALDTARKGSLEKIKLKEQNHQEQMMKLKEEKEKASERELEELSKKMVEMEERYKKATAAAQQREEELRERLDEQKQGGAVSSFLEVVEAVVPFAFKLFSVGNAARTRNAVDESRRVASISGDDARV